VLFLAAVETETVRKLYTKIADAYGCLGVLNLGGCTLFFLLHSPAVSRMVVLVQYIYEVFYSELCMPVIVV